MSRDAFVFAGLRTPRGKGSPKGALHPFTPIALVGQLFDALTERVALAPHKVDDVILGCATQVDEQGTNVARTAALVKWGHAANVPGVTLNRFCASGLDAVNTAAARVKAGDAQLILAGGVESVSRVPMLTDRGPLYSDPNVMAAAGSVHMGIAADLVATMEGFSRAELDEYALTTRARARKAWASGVYTGSVIPIRNLDGTIACDRDEMVAFEPTLAEVSALPPAFAELGASGQDAIVRKHHPQIGELRHLHTRASSPALADAAALVVIGNEETAKRTGWKPRARIVATATCAGDPVIMLVAGQTAVERLLARAGLTPRDIDVFQFAEAFSALCLRFQRDLETLGDRFNPHGGTMAMGHAFGATGAILLIDVVEELERRGARYGVAAVSGAAGIGVATLVERI